MRSNAMRGWVLGLALWGGAANASTSLGSDFSDLWFNPNESGWGVNMIQQHDTIFATIFVYGVNRQPEWYVASAAVLVNPNVALHSFTGPLYQTNGPWLGGTFNPSSVTVRQVGTFSFFANNATSGSIAYTVDGAQVFKDVQRQTWKVENLTGTYPGASAGTQSSCASGNGAIEAPETLAISQAGENITVVQAGSGRTCTYQGGYAQAGRMGTILASGACSDGVNRTLEANELQVGRGFLTGRMVIRAGTCRFEGTFAGPRRP